MEKATLVNHPVILSITSLELLNLKSFIPIELEHLNLNTQFTFFAYEVIFKESKKIIYIIRPMH